MFISRKQSGFTLVEIIIVISIMGIIGGLSSMIIGRSLDSYAALERREKLQTSVRLAVELISRELRHALPHSICVHDGTNCNSGTGNRFYFVPVKDSGRYQDRPGAYPGSSGILRERIGIAPLARQNIDVISTDRITPLQPINSNDWMVVYNINNTDIYAGINDIRQPINAVIQKDIHNDGLVSTDIDQIQLSAAASFANHSPTRRFHIVDNNSNKPVTLFYFDGVNSLFRDATTFANPNTQTADTRLLMQNVSACTFTYTPGSLTRAGLLHIDITVALQGEQIRVIHDAHIYNTP